jgi:hypothetical protein
MTKHSTATQTELANRANDGVEVTLVWSQSDGSDELVVCVSDLRAGAYFEIPAKPASALDVYYHPFAYREISTLNYEDSRLAA